MEMVSHLLNEHSEFDMDQLSENASGAMQMTLYVSRASVFLYFFIWPLNYFLRFPKLRAELCRWSRKRTIDSRRSTSMYSNTRKSASSSVHGNPSRVSNGSGIRLSSTSHYSNRKDSSGAL